jgi:hypothetical protein
VWVVSHGLEAQYMAVYRLLFSNRKRLNRHAPMNSSDRLK